MHGRNSALMGGVCPVGGTAPLTRRSLYSGFRNLFTPGQAQKFSAGGLVAQARAGDDQPLRRLLRKLSERMARQDAWPDTLPSADPALQPSENPRIPSGYTYLLQLMAHDLIDSAVSLAAAGAGGSGFVNSRVEPLALDTIYGDGPDNVPQAYEIDPLFRQNMGAVPRTRLRLGRLANAAGAVDASCPFRDLARGYPVDTIDAGLRAGERLDAPKPFWRPWRTEVLAADVRNDSHALISQMTVLFHLLHNHILQMIGPPSSDPVLAYRRFVCARLVVTLIYRAVIRRDVMRRILHPAVYARYVTGGQPLLEDDARYGGAIDAGDMILEFSHGAFRFGHAMVRDAYRVNSAAAEPFVNALDQSSTSKPGNLPVRSVWHVDWSRFFHTETAAPNWSMRIGPSVSGALRNSFFFPPFAPGVDGDGVQARDLVGAAFAGLWSVPALTAELRSLPGIADLLPDHGVWKGPLRAWLESRPDDFDPADVDILVDDPPLPFFVLFEAGHALAAGTPSREGGGAHLGPLGSVIVAETILGALRRNRLGYEDAGETLAERIAAVCRDLVGDAAALAGVPDIAEMTDLLRFMRDGGAIALPGPA